MAYPSGYATYLRSVIGNLPKMKPLNLNKMSKGEFNKVNNFFVPKAKINKDGSLDYAIMMYLSQDAGYNDYKILSVSVVDATDHPENDGTPKYMVTVVTDEVEMIEK